MDNFAFNENDTCGHSSNMWMGDLWTGDAWLGDLWTGDVWMNDE